MHRDGYSIDKAKDKTNDKKAMHLEQKRQRFGWLGHQGSQSSKVSFDHTEEPIDPDKVVSCYSKLINFNGSINFYDDLRHAKFFLACPRSWPVKSAKKV